MRRAPAAIFLAFAMLLAACGPSPAITDLKAAIQRLRDAGERESGTPDDYADLIMDAQFRLERAKDSLSDEAVTACGNALSQAVDAQRVWNDLAGTEQELSPAARGPLERLGVVKTDADFQQDVNAFAAIKDSPDGLSAKQGMRADARQSLIKQSLAAAGQALAKAEARL